jgi:hypothetical protein
VFFIEKKNSEIVITLASSDEKKSLLNSKEKILRGLTDSKNEYNNDSKTLQVFCDHDDLQKIVPIIWENISN